MHISNQILNNNIFDLINPDLINYYNTPGEIIRCRDFSKDKNIDLRNCTLISLLNLLIDNGYYKKNKFVKKLIN